MPVLEKLGFGKTKKLEGEISDLRSQLTQIKNQTLVSSSDPAVVELFGALPSSAGISVTPESAKRSTAVYACVRLIAGAVSVMPLTIYERNDEGRKKSDHDVWWLLNEEPYPILTASTFWDWVISNLLLRGDGIAEILRNRAGQPVGFMPLPRECVRIERKGHELVYYISDGISRPYGRIQSDILHFPGFGFNGTCGESVVLRAARQSIGTALAADQFSGEFFANGAHPSVVIQYPEKVAPTDEQQKFLREQLEERTTGIGKRHRPLLLVNGGTLQTVSLSAQDSQLLQTRQFQVVDIARGFGVPPHMIGENSGSTVWGTGLEQISIGFVRYSMNPLLTGIEQEINRKLWPRSRKYFAEFNREGLLSGDSKAEAEYFAKALGGPGTQGYMAVNEVRRIKNLPPDPNPKMNQVIEAGSVKPGTKPDDKPEEKAA